jgi:hypothetical protein
MEGGVQCGYRRQGLLDVQLITDVDIAARSTYAVKVDAVTVPAHKLEMQESPAVES